MAAAATPLPFARCEPPVSRRVGHFTATGLPHGLSISRRGVIAGTISGRATGAHAVTVRAKALDGGRDSVNFTWTVHSQS